MFGHEFYNETTRRYVAIFGTLFNDIAISRKDNSSSTIQRMKVPVNYGPMQKFLAMMEQDPDFTAPAITLPRISFEIIDMSYDGERNLTSLKKLTRGLPTNDSRINSVFTPAPYNITFQLNIMTKYAEDGTKILEQILPFFKPEFTVSAKLIDDMELYYDIPIVLQSITTEDIYEGEFTQRRSLIWTLTFTMKGYYFGPVSEGKVIKFAKVDIYNKMDTTDPVEYVSAQPGLTANGEPTTNISNTIDWADINFDDPWDYVVVIEEY